MSKEENSTKGVETLKSVDGQNALFRLDAFASFLMFLLSQKVTSEYLNLSQVFVTAKSKKSCNLDKSLNRAFCPSKLLRVSRPNHHKYLLTHRSKDDVKKKIKKAVTKT